MQTVAPIDMRELLKDAPRGEWLALSNDETRIVATSPSFEEAIEKAIALGETDPLMMKVPPPHTLVL